MQLIEVPPAPSDSFDPKEFRQLLAAVDKAKPTPADRAALQQCLRANPGLVGHFGNLALTMRERILSKLCGKESTTELVIAHCDQLRASLNYDEASGLERMVIDHIILCWVRWQDCEWWYQNHMDTPHTLTSGAYWERKLTLAQHRYLKAIETLARIRKLNINVQINLANQQIVTG